MGHADVGHVGDPRMLDEHVLGLRRVEVHAAGHHHVREPVGDVDEAVVVDIADLAEGEHPRFEVGGPGLLRVVVVHDAPAGGVAEIEPALGVGRHPPVVVIHHQSLERRHRAADRAGMSEPVLTGDGARRPHLGRPVGVDEDRAPPIDHGPLHVVGAFGPGVRDQPHRRGVVAVADRGRQGEEAHEVGGDHDRALDAMAFDGGEGRLGVEPAEDHRGNAGEAAAGRA